MNKNLIIGAVLILAAGGAYYQFAYKPGQVAEMAKAAEDAATKAADEAAAAAKAADEAAAAKKLTDDAAAAAAAATETATAATGTMAEMMAALDPANFDAAKINAMIDASTLDATLKTTLKAGIDAAAADPTKIAGAVAAVKTAMGM